MLDFYNGRFLSRRQLLRGFMVGGTLLASQLPGTRVFASKERSTEFKLPPLPFAQNALEPYISAKTISFHYGKHHSGYVKKLNKFIADTDYQGSELEQIIRRSAEHPKDVAIFNNAAQVWNHTFYWHSMKPGGGGPPSGRLAELMRKHFGGYEGFQQAFAATAASQFGSGWAWLVMTNDSLEVMKTGNADNPLTHGAKPLITIDIWEHAYYLDYQNRRADYIASYLDHLVNWDFAADNLV